MRVTNGMMINTYLKNLNRNMGAMDASQEQMSTTRRINKLSDDPVGAIKVLTARAKLSANDQYQKNIADAKYWLSQTESQTLQINEALKRVTELAVNLGNDVYSEEDRQAAAVEIGQLRDQIITSANGSFNDYYLFGNYNVTQRPFDAVPADNTTTPPTAAKVLFNGVDLLTTQPGVVPTEVRHFEIGFGLDFDVSIEGPHLLGYGDENIYKMLDNLYQAASSKDYSGDKIRQMISPLRQAQERILAVDATVGGRINRLEFMEDCYSMDKINYTQTLSDVEDLDMGEAIINFSMMEAVYRASLSVGGKVIQPTLMDFLR